MHALTSKFTILNASSTGLGNLTGICDAKVLSLVRILSTSVTLCCSGEPMCRFCRNLVSMYSNFVFCLAFFLFLFIYLIINYRLFKFNLLLLLSFPYFLLLQSLLVLLRIFA
jgi:hypothetical protein